MPSSLVLYSTTAYQALADRIAALGSFERAEFDQQEFPDSERYYRLTRCVEGSDVALIGGTCTDRDTMEIYDKAWALVTAGARSLTIVVPYFAYSTMERVTKPGEVVMAKSRAHLLSSIPDAVNGNRIVLLDLHSEGIPYYFDGHVRPVHLYAKRLIVDAAREMGGDAFVLASTDAGRAKWVESLANDLQVEAAFVYKRRLDGCHTQVTGISATVQNKLVIIYDDMIRTGGSLIQAAKAYRDAGAKEIIGMATHGLFPGESLTKLRSSGLFRKIVCTDSHPRACQLADDFLEVRSIDRLVSDYLTSGDRCEAAIHQAGHHLCNG